MGTMSAHPEFVTHAEFLALKADVDELGPMLRNFTEDQTTRDIEQKREQASFIARQQVFLANQEIRDKELRRQVRGLQREDAELRDSVKDLSAEAAKAEMIRIASEKDKEIARKDSLIKALREDKRETRGWVVWAVRAAVPAAAIAAWETFRYLFWKGP